MNYLGRPVFEFAIDWGNPINKSFASALDEVAVGFGAETLIGLQEHTVQGFEFVTLLQSAAAIDGLDSFFDALIGRLQGFWLPAPIAACKWLAAVDATHFDVVGQDLAETWEDNPDIYLWFGTSTPQIRRITAVAAVTAGERIALASALDIQPTAETPIRRLHYVRLAADDETGETLSEGMQLRSLRVIELPGEYTAYELGLRPIYLYEFSMAAPATMRWRYTSFAADVVSGNKLFSTFAISHGALKSSARPQDQALVIECAHDPAHPLSLFLPLAPQRPMSVTVSKCSYSDLDDSITLFTGQVRSIEDDGSKLSATCDQWWHILARKTPRMMIQPTCNYTIFDPATCRVLRAGFETVCEIVALAPDANPPTVTVDLLFSGLSQLADWVLADWFAGGFLETGSGLGFECRTILSSALDTAPSTVLLELNAPLRHAAVGQWMQLIPGCNGALTTCEQKFNNAVNFGGFPDIPTRNLALKALNTTTSQGGKK